MTDQKRDDEHTNEDLPDSDEAEFVILSAEDSHLAELLGTCKHGDWAGILNDLSESAKEEIRAAIGKMLARYEMRRKE